MAIDAYVMFVPYQGNPPDSESQVDMSGDKSDLAKDFQSQPAMTLDAGKIKSFGHIFEIEDYSFDIEQTLNIGSQSGGSGAGKVTFNPFSITRKIDAASPMFFKMACAGTPFKTVSLGLRKSVGTGTDPTGQAQSGSMFCRFDFKLVAVKTISWAHDDESPKETVTFEYGGMLIRYMAQNPDGSFKPTIAGGWNRVRNVSDESTTAL